MEDLVKANITLLDQAARLLTAMADPEYSRPDGTLYGSSVGQHLRHCLDHYSSFLHGLSEGVIDYDHRARVGELECSTDCAREKIAILSETLNELGSDQFGKKMKVRVDCGGGDGIWHETSLGRELQFLVSHTIHHFAMINGMCSQRGIRMEEGFGMAPSTLRHRKLAHIE